MISKNDVKYVASLSRIHLKDEEVQALTQDLERILGYIKNLEKLDTSHVEPTSHVLPLKNVFREDIIKPSFSQQEALKISVEQQNGFFKVPKIIE
ncbi:MAG: Asp-tRNA(Asn)/Glu-tRNA(Gln) amidotransferase subunit GatC [Candidatus Omnitrophica bacterium]|nr:Asp-tRNA(Asn)/Glu-tRNA(Gln) amidotransferase subunit GatC [Candidatus Omnitrophota bacterium]